ncbi:MAG TPA: hypothetical protein VJO99_12025, partial [Burkholderiaceae bacterium]|nr:hypothetical protein [Burkholderiaceae bacterium]
MVARHDDDDNILSDDIGDSRQGGGHGSRSHASSRTTHVVKRLSPTQAGALKLARRYGDALVCVRYRHDAAGRHRYTTVELIIDEAPIVPRGH